MSQPTYSDMGKACRDFFSKGYYLGIFKINAKNKACDGFETVATGTHNLEDQTALGEFEGKGKCPWGVVTTGKWNTKNLFTGKVEVENKLAQGLKLGLEGQYNLESSAKLGKLTSLYKLDKVTLEFGVEGGDESNLLVNGAAVCGYRDFLAGYQISYDTNDGVLKKSNVALGYNGNGWTLHTNLDGAETIAAALHYRVRDNLEAGISTSYTSGDDVNATKYELGIKYILNSCTSIKAKVDNTATLSMGYEYQLTGGTTLFLCSQCTSSNVGKVGLGVEFGS